MPLHATDLPDVDRRELATLLAALRLLQAAPALPPEIEEIDTEQGDFERLDDEEIDAPCERLNAALDDAWHETARDDPDRESDDAALAARVASLFEEIER
jgi:hypothetical protein